MAAKKKASKKARKEKIRTQTKRSIHEADANLRFPRGQ